MIFIKLDTLDTASNLTRVCEKYKGDMSIDVLYGRYIVDGRSILGVTSLLGNIVRIDPITCDHELIEDFTKEVKKIGAWIIG